MKFNLDDAIAIAMDAHRCANDRGGQPYILHPLRVMLKCDSELERIVGVLHDVIEDTNCTLERLRLFGCNDDVIIPLCNVTKLPMESYSDFIKRAASNPISRVVKIADIEDNMDIRRLPSFEQKDLERMAKYLNAWKYLKGI